IVVISAGPDGVINTPCPAVDTAASSVVATGDDMVAARSYGEMVSFGNAQIASTLSALGTNSNNNLCRLGSDGKMICDVTTGLNNNNTGRRLCRTDFTGSLVCDGVYPISNCSANQRLTVSIDGSDKPSFTCQNISSSASSCGANQASRWNGSTFDCVNIASSASSCEANQTSRWNGTTFECVNQIQGPQGLQGPAGTAGTTKNLYHSIGNYDGHARLYMECADQAYQGSGTNDVWVMTGVRLEPYGTPAGNYNVSIKCARLRLY
ncbi:MAG: hypothetical protein ACK5WY_08645, partial [Holosporaceae bacterium]